MIKILIDKCETAAFWGCSFFIVLCFRKTAYMKQILISFLLSSTILTAAADTPGKATNHASKVTLQNVSSLGDYTLYWRKHYHDTTIIVTGDTSLVIPGSGGAPDGATFWGIHKKTKKSTDTITFSNYYDPDYVLLLNGMRGDSIRYMQDELSNQNEIVKTANKDSISNKQLVLDAEKVTRNHTLKNVLLGALAGAALGGLTWFFIRRRKKKEKDAATNIA
jgi:hypothetical protein